MIKGEKGVYSDSPCSRRQAKETRALLRSLRDAMEHGLAHIRDKGRHITHAQAAVTGHGVSEAVLLGCAALCLSLLLREGHNFANDELQRFLVCCWLHVPAWDGICGQNVDEASWRTAGVASA